MRPLPFLSSVASVVFFASVSSAQTNTHLTAWLIPAEDVSPSNVAQGEDIRSQVDRFNSALAGTSLTVLNTIDPLAMKLFSWNPEFAVPNAALVLSQQKTLAALSRFARSNKVDIDVRFMTWDDAFNLLRSINPKRHTEGDPDVVQIGSTWASYFARERLIMSRPGRGKDRGNWKNTLDLPASVLPYITDVRMLFYWKRLPSASPGSDALILNASSWQSVVESIRDQGSSDDTIVFPTGLTLNLLHDYVPLVWAGGGPFLFSGWLGTRIDLVSRNALAVPEYLARNARIEPRPGEPRRLITFPESSHDEVARTFVSGGYRATLEPAAFIDRWYQDFARREPADRRFWDYAAAVVPPTAFKGGSDLVVLQGSKDPRRAFALADFLSSDPRFTRELAEAGDLPAGRAGYGIDVLLGSLAQHRQSVEAQAFSRAVLKAIDQGRSYPDLAAWPIAVENEQVIEALQTVWRRVAEGDIHGLAVAAGQAQWSVNARINPLYWLLDQAIQGWQLLTGILLLSLAAILYLYIRRLRAERARISAQSAALRADAERVRVQTDLLDAERQRLRERKQAEEAQKQAEEALSRAQAELALAMRVTTMGELTASLAHELNQPIAAVIINSNTCLRWLARAPPDMEEARAAAARSVKDATRAADIIKGIRSMFKKSAVQREAVDVNEVIREMIVLLHNEATRYSVAIRTNLAARLPQVLADRVQLQQVFMNLMLNGIEAMKEVNVGRELTIKSEPAQNSLC